MDASLVMTMGFVVFVALFIVASKRSVAGRLSTALQPFVGKTVDVRLWGQPIGAYRVSGIRGIGAGLHFFLEPVSGGPSAALKIAQPGTARHDEREVVIADARYVQLSRRRVPRVEGHPALEIRVS